MMAKIIVILLTCLLFVNFTGVLLLVKMAKDIRDTAKAIRTQVETSRVTHH